MLKAWFPYSATGVTAAKVSTDFVINADNQSSCWMHPTPLPQLSMSAAAAKRAKGKPVSKPTAKQKPTSEESDDERATGLWVNTEFLRNLTKRAPQTVLHGSTPPKEENYYLKLADIILGPTEKRKVDRSTQAFGKFKKPKPGR